MAGLLNVGEMGALGLHVLVNLAVMREQDADARRTVQEIAEKLHASVHTLQKVARRLIMMGLVEGTRGVNGGLRLMVDPEKISMLEVIEGVEGKINCNNCMFAKRVCPQNARCIFDGVTGGLETMVREYFARTTVADMRASAMQPA